MLSCNHIAFYQRFAATFVLSEALETETISSVLCGFSGLFFAVSAPEAKQMHWNKQTVTICDCDKATRPMASASPPNPSLSPQKHTHTSWKLDRLMIVVFFKTRPSHFLHFMVFWSLRLVQARGFDLNTTMFTQSNWTCSLFLTCEGLFLEKSVYVSYNSSSSVCVRVCEDRGGLFALVCLLVCQCSSHVLSDWWPWPGDDTLQCMWPVAGGCGGTLSEPQGLSGEDKLLSDARREKK